MPLRVRKTEVDLSWNAIPCPHRHGIICHYLIRYDHVLPPRIQVEKESKALGNHSRINIQNLRSNIYYTVRVAGVNRVGIGFFSLPITLLTPGGKKWENGLTMGDTCLFHHSSCPGSVQIILSESTRHSVTIHWTIVMVCQILWTGWSCVTIRLKVV